MNFKKALGTFVEFEEKEKEPPAPPTSTIPGIPGITHTAAASAPGPDPGLAATTKTPSTDTSVVSGWVDFLRGKLKSNSGYSIFAETMESLRGVVDDGQLLTATVKVLGKQGQNPQSIVGRLEESLQLLSSENSKFHATLDQRKKQEIDSREAHIQDLGKQIQQLKDERDRVSGELVEQKGKSASMESGFASAISLLSEELNDMKSRIQGGVHA